MIFAVIPEVNDYLFTQGVLGVVCIGLIAVVVYQQRKIDRTAEVINQLQEARLSESKAHAIDYREMAKHDQEVLLGNSQANQLLAAKIEAVKGS